RRQRLDLEDVVEAGRLLLDAPHARRLGRERARAVVEDRAARRAPRLVRRAGRERRVVEALPAAQIAVVLRDVELAESAAGRRVEVDAVVAEAELGAERREGLEVGVEKEADQRLVVRRRREEERERRRQEHRSLLNDRRLGGQLVARKPHELRARAKDRRLDALARAEEHVGPARLLVRGEGLLVAREVRRARGRAAPAAAFEQYEPVDVRVAG